MEQYDEKEKSLILICLIMGAILGAFGTFWIMSLNPPKVVSATQIADNIEHLMFDVEKYPFFINKDMSINIATGYYVSYKYQARGLLETLGTDICTKNFTQIVENQKDLGFFKFK
jgi:hypothetical protein